ncbi:pilus assembly protein TadG-related protein [Sporohalobacter salinus]|uniref:pilus assembly protein TadG-related protein n=1 Tax=Sporohalobacter salinus TaxID=1494606 RepID=UPI001961AE65|nr:TadE/TadG family type IV pilus assembly protein [Sporohalobacter salinus]MBM7623015.1 hypothetical protein [Sporohalobacter salinus]
MSFFSSKKGTVIVVVALLMTIFISFLALVIDVGTLYLERIRLVNTLDAAALAGVQELPIDPQLAKNTAVSYANQNGLVSSNLTVEITDDKQQINLSGTNQVGMNFAVIFGINQVEVVASSKARIGKVTAIAGAVPFGVVNQEFVYGDKYYLKYGAGGNGVADGRNGNFGALALGGNGANNYEDNIKYGYGSQLEVGQEVTTEPGNMSGPTARGVEYRLDQCDSVPACTFDSVKSDCPQLVMVPVIDSLGNGRSTSTIVGFAAFFLEGLTNGNGNGNNSYVEGRFISWMTQSGEMGSEGENFNLRTIKLID